MSAELKTCLKTITETQELKQQSFYFALQGMLSNKGKSSWQELGNYHPPGDGDSVVNSEILLQDDLYFPSPIMLCLRMQHLEEAHEFLNALTSAIKDAAGAANTVTYDAVQKAFAASRVLSSVDEKHIQRGFQNETTTHCDSFLFNIQRGHNLIPNINHGA